MSKRIKSLVLLAVMVVLVSGTDQPANKSEKKITVAVYPVRVTNGDKSLSPALTTFFVDELSQSNILKVVESALMDEVLKKLNYDNSDMCDKTQCQLQVGKMTPAQKMVVPELTKLGDKWVLIARVVDIETGEISSTSRQERVCKEDELDQLVAAVCLDLRVKLGENVNLPHSYAQAQPQTTAHTPASPPFGNNTPVVQEFHPAVAKGGPMVSVPAGDFMMGCNEQVDKQCKANEKPYHKVYLDAYYIDKFRLLKGNIMNAYPPANAGRILNIMA